MTDSNPNPAAHRFYVPGEYRPEEGVGYLMRNILNSLRAQSNAQLAAYDLTYVQWLPLYKIAQKDGYTVAELARELEIDPGAMTRSMDRLEAKGLVRRERSTADRRVVYLVLTEEGRQVANQVPAVTADVVNAHLRGFSEKEWQLLLEFLNRMLVNAEAMRQSPLD